MSHNGSKTEEVAVTVHCPMRLEFVELKRSQSLCLGSGCMAWRWNAMPDPKYIRAENGSAESIEDAGARPNGDGWEFVPYDLDNEVYVSVWRETDEALHARREGYCGLAGLMIAGKGGL
jgi:hypothetical protein